MDVKTRYMAKGAKTAQKAEKKKTLDHKYTEEEKLCITKLKKLYLDTIKLDVELQKEIYNLEKSYECHHNEVFDKRAKVLNDFKKQSQGGDSSSDAGYLKHFWLKVLKAAYTEFISKKDEQILMHLSDIRSKLYNQPTVKFVIEFHFEPNEYFSNRILTKTYFLNCLPNIDDPLTYEGAEIYKCEGCTIEWKQEEKENDKTAFVSFFDFFEPPILPENANDPTYGDINAILQNDFELGFYLKERVIPKAIMFFTGEIADCQSSDSETESDEDDDDDDEAEEVSSVHSASAK